MKVVQEINRSDWREFIYHHHEGNIFQSPEMYDIYKDTTNFEPIFLAVVNANDGVLGVLLSYIQREYNGLIGGLTTRSIIWGGPLVKNDDRKVLAFILQEYEKIVCKKAIFTQFRNLWDNSNSTDVFVKQRYRHKEHLNFIVDLSVGKERLFANLSASKRRQIRKAREKENVEIIDTESEEDVIEFYTILSSYYSHFVKKPLPSLEFFLLILKKLVKQKLAKIFVIRNKGRIIGGIVCPISNNFEKQTIYELYVCGSRAHDNLYPSIMATWAPIEWGAENSIDCFDFMGAGRPNVDYGVREFKSKFGGRLVNYGRFEQIHQPIKFEVAKIGFKLWQVF